MFWSCLLGTVIQFTQIFPHDVIIALTDEFSFTADITLVKGSYEKLFKHEFLQSHPVYAPFLSAMLPSRYAVHKEAEEEEEET